MALKVVLHSFDEAVWESCHAILAEIGGDGHRLIVPPPGQSIEDSDVYIWDREVHAGILEEQLAKPGFHAILTDQAGTNSIDPFLLPCAVVLLKPVSAVALGSFLKAAAELGEAQGTRSFSKPDYLSLLGSMYSRMQVHEMERESFLAMALHDFRVPLTASNGYCRMLLDGVLGTLNDLQTEVLGRTQKSLDRLSRMTNGMFDLSLGSKSRKRMVLDTGEITESLTQATHEIRPLALERDIRLNVDAIPAEFRYDHDRIEQVLLNLLENACKFTPRGGTIEVTGALHFWDRRSPRVSADVETNRRRDQSHVPNCYRIDIANTAHPNRPGLFNQFLDDPALGSKTQGSGTGLGLAICKLIIRQHRGRIWAEHDEAMPRLSFALPLTPPIRSGLGDFKGRASESRNGRPVENHISTIGKI